VPSPGRLTNRERDRQDSQIRALLPVIPSHYQGEDRCAAIRGLYIAVNEWRPGGMMLDGYAKQRARNEVLDERKWGRRSRRTAQLNELILDIPRDPSRGVEAEEFWRVVYAAISNPRHLAIIDYIYRREGKGSELAKFMGVTQAAITKTKNLAVAKLRDVIEGMAI
jgi:DNA-directed RNA polymerase specialized sigma24 family protein